MIMSLSRSTNGYINDVERVSTRMQMPLKMILYYEDQLWCKKK